jgi:trimeric autotransporter adhesin
MRGDRIENQGNLEGRVEMKRRYAVLGLSVFLALALAVPALGGPTNPVASISASAKSIANKALKTAKAAQKTANAANGTANTALSTANTANGTANSALGEAKKGVANAAAAQATANAAKKAAEEANANANTRVLGALERSASTETNTETSKNASALCEGNEVTLGGGFFVGGSSNSVSVNASEHMLYGNGWFVSARAISGTPSWSLTAYTMCGTH